MSLPIIRLSRTPYEQGLQHGRALKDRIAHNLEIYFDRFEQEGELPRAEVLSRARQYARAIETQNPAYFESLRGVADGSGYPLEELVALNVRYEILYHQFTAIALVGGCTSFALLPEASANGHLIMGQNWDWIPQVKGAVLQITEPGGLEILCFTEAGIVGGKIGLNSAGIGLAINGLLSTDDDWSRLQKPFHVRCYEILRSRDFEGAVRVVTETERSCSTNFLIAQTPDRVVDIEAAPKGVRLLECKNGCLVHTNHFLAPKALGVIEPPSERRPHSYHRRARLATFLEAKQPVSLQDLQTYLRDHDDYPYGLCRHEDMTEPPEDRYITVTSVIMDLYEQTMWLTDGPPCQGEYQKVRFAV